jgi:hypothetical protein
MNKKGIMVKFLVSVLLAIVIFVPACMFVSDFFRLSTQGKDNFIDFAELIEEVSMKEGDWVGSDVLIMDKNTFIINFKAGESEVRCIEPKGGSVLAGTKTGGSEDIWKYPKSKCGEKDCLCLFREYEIQQGSGNNCGFKKSPSEIIVSREYHGTNIQCAPPPNNFEIIAEDLMRTEFVGDERRIEVGIKKEGNKIYLCNGQCE